MRIRLQGMNQEKKCEDFLTKAPDRAAIFVTIFRAAKRDSHWHNRNLFGRYASPRLFSPSTKTLLRYAQATGNKFHVRLSAA
jgi:hypothetical protein